eukprot:869457-Pelagomonas_calceolata.AAC.2
MASCKLSAWRSSRLYFPPTKLFPKPPLFFQLQMNEPINPVAQFAALATQQTNVNNAVEAEPIERSLQ